MTYAISGMRCVEFISSADIILSIDINRGNLVLSLRVIQGHADTLRIVAKYKALKGIVD